MRKLKTVALVIGMKIVEVAAVLGLLYVLGAIGHQWVWLNKGFGLPANIFGAGLVLALLSFFCIVILTGLLALACIFLRFNVDLAKKWLN